LKSANVKTVEHREEAGEERHTRYVQEHREKPRPESFPCRTGTLTPFIRSLAPVGVSQVPAAVTHAVTQLVKVEPCSEGDCSPTEEGSPLQISAPTQLQFLDADGNR